jgi:hypothetical protein
MIFGEKSPMGVLIHEKISIWNDNFDCLNRQGMLAIYLLVG